jgi:hypothetical protein
MFAGQYSDPLREGSRVEWSIINSEEDRFENRYFLKGAVMKEVTPALHVN